MQILEEQHSVIFSESDLMCETTKGSGPGGQNKNKVETAVKLTHLPTGLAVSATEERSQHMNKKKALLRMKEKIDSLNINSMAESARENWMNHNRIIRGNSRLTFRGKNFIRVR